MGNCCESSNVVPKRRSEVFEGYVDDVLSRHQTPTFYTTASYKKHDCGHHMMCRRRNQTGRMQRFVIHGGFR